MDKKEKILWVIKGLSEKINKVIPNYKNSIIAFSLAFLFFVTNGSNVSALNESKKNKLTFENNKKKQSIDVEDEFLENLKRVEANMTDDEKKELMLSIPNSFELSFKYAKEFINTLVINEVKPSEGQILEKYNLTYDEFLVISAVVLTEAAGSGANYEDAYNVINVIYNRTKSIKWSNYITNVTGLDGTNLYSQVICPGQFEVYSNGSYKKKMGVTNLDGYQAILDFLLSEETVHNNLSFYGDGSQNHYYNTLTDDDRISVLERKK